MLLHGAGLRYLNSPKGSATDIIDSVLGNAHFTEGSSSSDSYGPLPEQWTNYEFAVGGDDTVERAVGTTTVSISLTSGPTAGNLHSGLRFSGGLTISTDYDLTIRYRYRDTIDANANSGIRINYGSWALITMLGKSTDVWYTDTISFTASSSSFIAALRISSGNAPKCTVDIDYISVVEA